MSNTEKSFSDKAAEFKKDKGIEKGSEEDKAVDAYTEQQAAVTEGGELPGKTAGELVEELKRQEAKEEFGAPSRTPKHDMLDARALEQQNPDKYYRYVSVRTEDKAMQRKHEGFTVVSEDEARAAGVNAKLGTSVLMEQDRRRHDARVERQETENDRRLRQHRGEVEKVVESVAREMKDRYGIDIPVERLFVND